MLRVHTHPSFFTFLSYTSMLYWFNHHGNSFEGVGPPMELCPVDSILVAAAVVSTPVPHPVQIGMGTHVVPPATFLIMSTVTWFKKKKRAENRLVNVLGWKQSRLMNKIVGRTDLRSCPCLDLEWWKPCCCARRASPPRCRCNAPAAVCTSRSPAPGGSCRTQQTPADPASPLETPSAYTGPVWSSSRDVRGQANTLRPGSQSLAINCKHTGSVERKDLFFKNLEDWNWLTDSKLLTLLQWTVPT